MSYVFCMCLGVHGIIEYPGFQMTRTEKCIDAPPQILVLANSLAKSCYETGEIVIANAKAVRKAV